MTTHYSGRSSVTFTRVLLRVGFVVGLLLLLAAPQLMMEQPGGVFARVKHVLVDTSPLVWGLLVGVVGVLLWLWTIPSRQTATGAVAGQAAAEALPISEAVLPMHGGNGLVTQSYEPGLSWLGLIGWIEIKDPGKECVVVDGRRIIRKTELYIGPMRLLGKPISARRVLLQPAPITDISAKSLTRDQWELALVVSAKYEVINPVYTASLQAPLDELGNRVVGAVAEYIRSDDLTNIVKDEGALRATMQQTLESAPSIAGTYHIVEILKALPTGDERVIEEIRRARVAQAQSAVIAAEGANEVARAQYLTEIQRKNAVLSEEVANLQHARDMERLGMEQTFETQRELLRAVGMIAAAGIDPARAIERIRAVVLAPPAPPALTTATEPTAVQLMALEEARLQEAQDVLGLKKFMLKANANGSGRPVSAQLTFENFSVDIQCPPEYPDAPPVVWVQSRGGEPAPLVVPWSKGNNLVDVAIVAAMQAQYAQAVQEESHGD